MAGTVEEDSFEADDGSLRSSNDSKNFHDSVRELNTESGDSRSTDTEIPSDREEIAKLALRETRHVRVWRRNVLLMILLLGATVTTLTFIFLRDEDQEDFSTSFHQFASTLEDAVEFHIKGVLQATQGLSQILTAEAIATASTWPFVTLSSFEVYVGNTRAQASSELIVVAPIVSKENLPKWNEYSNENQGWIDESFAVYGDERNDFSPIPSSCYRFGRFKGRTVLVSEDGSGNYPAAPFWTMSRPPFDTSIVNFNALSTEPYQKAYDIMTSTRKFVFGEAGANELISYTMGLEEHDALHGFVHDEHDNSTHASEHEVGLANDHPHTPIQYPVFQSLNEEGPIVAMVVNVIPWDNYLKGALPEGANGIYAVLHNSLGQSFTYMINGNDARYVGAGDFHDSSYDGFEYIIGINSFVDDSELAEAASVEANNYWLAVYPSAILESEYDSNLPMIFAVVSGCGFLLMAFTFLLYDYMVIRKNRKIMDTAARSNAILSSLFPKEVKQRLMEEKKENQPDKKTAFARGANVFQTSSSLGTQDYDDGEILKVQPIADLFPNTTVVFADIVGFTAWSSTREPSSVFILLETLFRAFDKVAAKRNVYKVETIGDCYVAVTGLPDPRKDHAVVMCRFAQTCMLKMQELTKKLEEFLGPDTSALSMRFGLHSGPVTAGVLRGERGRFQLFGDTVNTAARIESSGKPGRIHLSQDCAELLIAAGKSHWVEKRSDLIQAKGKGELQTYWLTRTTASPSEFNGSVNGGEGSNSNSDGVSLEQFKTPEFLNEKGQRLIQWNIQRFTALLESIAASRGNKKQDDNSCHTSVTDSASASSSALPVEEVKEVIKISAHSASFSSEGSGQVNPGAIEELEEYITIIAGMYDHNAFHNFEHASHVTMSVLKMMSRFASTSDNTALMDIPEEKEEEETELYNFASDPLTQFSCAFSALVHDVLHPGVPNAQLMKEDPEAGKHYKYKSVAEQRSFDIAWELLMENKFDRLRHAIYQTRAEESKFRQLVVNSVMATDVFDPDLKKLRNDRWQKAFGETHRNSGDRRTSVDRQATIVIEHLIQASDVSHTMQHWNVYRKWNQRLFEEMYQAYLDGRSEKDPSEFWYMGEIGFFDHYVIPLAKKLDECGVFGVSSHEYLDFALKNRKEWEVKGKNIVETMTVACLRAGEKRQTVLIEGIP